MITGARLLFAVAVCAAWATGCSVYSGFAQRTLSEPGPSIASRDVTIKWRVADAGTGCVRLGTIDVIGPVRKLSTSWMSKLQSEAAKVGASVVVVVKDGSGTPVDQQTLLTDLHPPDAELAIHGWAYRCKPPSP